MARQLTAAQQAERSIIKKYRKDLWNKFVMGLKDYRLICEGDRIALALSGGKSSCAMAKCMQHLKQYSPVKFELEYIFIDPGMGEDSLRKISDTFKTLDIPVRLFAAQAVSAALNSDEPVRSCKEHILKELISSAKKLGCTKLALAENFDDVIEYNFCQMVYEGRVESMMPRIYPDETKDIEIIRPMYMVKDSFLDDWVRYNGLDLTKGVFCETALKDCEQVKKALERTAYVKSLMTRFRNTNPNIENNIFKCVYNVNLRTVVAYSLHGERHEFLDRYDSLADDGEEEFSENE